VQLDFVECRRRLEQLTNEGANIVEVREDTGRVRVRLAAEELVAHLGPAIVDAAGLLLGRLDELGHDRFGERPVLDGERRLDGHERLCRAHAAHLLTHAAEARVNRPIGGAEGVHRALALVELLRRAVQLDFVECRRRLEQLTNEGANIVEVREDTGRVRVRLAAEELVAHLGPAIVDAAGLLLGRLDELGHDRFGERPVLDGERRLDSAQGVRANAR